MQDDLIDAVAWAIREKVADPDRIAIMGASYGGYATLVGLAFTPSTFACGVDVVGPSNLPALIESIPPEWRVGLETLVRRVGDPRTEEGRSMLASRSPIGRADRIRRPLLIAHGAHDPRVRKADTDQLVKAMQDQRVPLTYAVFPDEGHGFSRPENDIAFFAVAEAFLAQCLGGVYEPVGPDFEGSSITIEAGAGLVPGLAAALKK